MPKYTNKVYAPLFRTYWMVDVVGVECFVRSSLLHASVNPKIARQNPCKRTCRRWASIRHVSLIILPCLMSHIDIRFRRIHSRIAATNETARKNKPVIFGTKREKKTHRSKHCAVFFLQFGTAFCLGLNLRSNQKLIYSRFFSFIFFFLLFSPSNFVRCQCFYLCSSHKIHLLAKNFPT